MRLVGTLLYNRKLPVIPQPTSFPPMKVSSLRFYYTCYAILSLLLGLLLTRFTVILHLFIVFIPLMYPDVHSTKSLFTPKIIISIAIIDLIPNTLWLIKHPESASAIHALVACILLYTLPLVIFAGLVGKMQRNNLSEQIPSITLEPSIWQWCWRFSMNLFCLSLIIGMILSIMHKYLYLYHQGKLIIFAAFALFFILLWLEQTALLIADIKLARQAPQHKKSTKITIIEITKYFNLLNTRIILIILALWIIALFLILAAIIFTALNSEYLLGIIQAIIFIVSVLSLRYARYQYTNSHNILCYNPKTQTFFLRQYGFLTQFKQETPYLARQDIDALVLRYQYKTNSYQLVIVPKEATPTQRSSYSPIFHRHTDDLSDPRKYEYPCLYNHEISNVGYTIAPMRGFLWHIRRIAWRSGLGVKIESI